MNTVKMLDLAQAVYDRYLRTDGEQRIDERRKAEVLETEAPKPIALAPFRAGEKALKMLGIELPFGSNDSGGDGVPAHTINPNLQIRP